MGGVSREGEIQVEAAWLLYFKPLQRCDFSNQASVSPVLSEGDREADQAKLSEILPTISPLPEGREV